MQNSEEGNPKVNPFQNLAGGNMKAKIIPVAQIQKVIVAVGQVIIHVEKIHTQWVSYLYLFPKHFPANQSI